MNLLEKRDYIYTHLHQFDEEFVSEIFNKMHSQIENQDTIIGYDVQTGEPLTQSSYRAELERRKNEIDSGEYTTHEELKKEIENWK